MAKVNFKARLQKLLDNELSSSSNDKNQVISAYQTLIDILQIPEIGKQLHGYHELLFACISQIILTSFNQYFDDNQLRSLLELASNACVLSMSQNQIIDGWLQNIEERTFEKPDNDEDDDDLYEDEEEDDDDDDDLYEDASESEEEEEKITTVRDSNKRSNRGRGNQREQNDSSRPNLNSAPSREKSPPLTQPISNQRNAHVAHSRGVRGGHQNSERNDVSENPTRGNNGRGARGNRGINNLNRGSDNGSGRGRGAPPFDNRYGVDLRLYDCYICGEYGHVRYDCPMKQGNSKPTSRGGFTNKKQPNRTKSSSSSCSIETIQSEVDQNKIQEVYNQVSKLLNSSQTTNERTKTFNLFLSLIKQLEKQYGENLSKIFLEKESIFYSLFCHIAQNDFLFPNDQYAKLYHLKNLLLPQKQSLLKENRSKFARQRTLIPLNIITEHIKTVTQMQQTIFNDFQEYIIRSTSPIPIVPFDLITFLLKSNIYIDIKSFEYFTKNILFDLKKEIFSNEQINELHSCLDIRIKRFERNNQKQIWKERLHLFKNDQILTDLNQWIAEFEQILKTNDIESKESSAIVVSHAMWYYIVLIMASSGHLNKEQYEYVLNLAIQSSLFNSIQKFYFQFYLNQGQPPINMKELNEMKIKLESNNNHEKEFVYELMKIILDRPKPGFNNQEIGESSPEMNDLTQINDQPKQIEDIIPIIDNHILSRLISLVEMICSDTNTFSNEQCTELLDKFLHQSPIVRPLSHADQQRLTSFYSRPISLNELKTHCLSIQSDLNDFLSLLKNRIPMNNDEIFDFLTQTIVNIFKTRQKYSNEKCQELKSLIQKTSFGKKRYQLINETYQKFRINKKPPPSINPILLNQLLTNILLHDYQAHLEFLTLLEETSQIVDLNEISIEFEINRCLLSTIILVITDVDFSNSSNIDFFRQRLQTIIEKQRDFFVLLLTEQQYQLIISRLKLKSNIDSLINLVKTNFNEKNFVNLINFIQNELKDKNDFEKMINFILYTFDNEFLSIEQTLQITNLIFQHSKLNNKSFKNLLQFLIDLLQLNIHSSPKVFLNLIDNNQTIDQIIIMLKAQNGKYAVAEWKKTMIHLLTILFDRQDNHQPLKDIAQQSPMLQKATYKQQLESYWEKTSENQSDENKQPSTIPKTKDTNEQSATHREMFHHLESDDASLNALAVKQLHTYLLDEQLSTELSLPKFIQALQIIFKNFQKFAQVSLDEWTTLIENNRGKIFSNDVQCDQLLMNILFVRLNMPNETLTTLQRLIQSKKAHERHDGLQKLFSLLRNTQINNEKKQTSNLPTISNQLYNTITRVVFDQKFHDNQVRQCVTIAKNCWLLDNDHRQKLDL